MTPARIPSPETAAVGGPSGGVIRSAGAGDRPAISALVSAAFGEKHAGKGPIVAGLVDRLRHDWESGRGFELVAASEGSVLGHVGMTRAYVDGLEELAHVLVISPLSVDPRWQGHGIGKALVRAALAKARETGWPLVFLEGAPSFYTGLGFVEAAVAGFTKPSVRIPDAAFMVHDTGAGPRVAAGALVYPEAFWETDTTGLRGDVLRQLCPELFDADGHHHGR